MSIRIISYTDGAWVHRFVGASVLLEVLNLVRQTEQEPERCVGRIVCRTPMTGTAHVSAWLQARPIVRIPKEGITTLRPGSICSSSRLRRGRAKCLVRARRTASMPRMTRKPVAFYGRHRSAQLRDLAPGSSGDRLPMASASMSSASGRSGQLCGLRRVIRKARRPDLPLQVVQLRQRVYTTPGAASILEPSTSSRACWMPLRRSACCT